MQSDAPYYAPPVPPPALYCPAPPGAGGGPCGAGAAGERPLLPPAPQRWLERPRYRLLWTGAGVLAGLSTINLIAAASIPAVDENATVWPLYLPLVGPFLQMRYVEGGAKALLAVNGALQVGGLALMIAGAAARRKIALYGDRLTVAPSPTPGGGVLSATLTLP